MFYALTIILHVSTAKYLLPKIKMGTHVEY